MERPSFIFLNGFPLRQSFDVEIELKASRLLNTQKEAHVDGCTVSERCRQSDRAG